MYDLQIISAADLKRCPIQLRPVCKETLEYIQLRDAIRDHGILVPLLVRPMETGHEVVDGNNRYEISRDLRLPGLPCHVVEMSDNEVLQYQLLVHASSIETEPVQYARRLWRIVEVEQALTLNELAMHIRKHPDWVRRILKLVRLSITAQEYLTEGHFGVKIGIELAKLPCEKQDELLEYLDDVTPSEFKDMIVQEARHHRENIKDRRVEERSETEYRFRSFKEVLDELERPTVAASVLSREKAQSALDGWNAHAKWVLMNDSATVADALDKSEREQARKAELLKRRTAEHLNRKREQE
ncbi:MAG: hypothetical protein DRQ39_06990 [Gammaproteobacteria bacterium]|nr:MAG: hypothetical protein DRQ39_06990 [Gammaproteobacteria bacterium]